MTVSKLSTLASSSEATIAHTLCTDPGQALRDVAESSEALESLSTDSDGESLPVLHGVSPSPTSTSTEEKWVEPLCRPDHARFVLFPLKHPGLWDMYKKVSFVHSLYAK
jgi:hypothetical protein